MKHTYIRKASLFLICFFCAPLFFLKGSARSEDPPNITPQRIEIPSSFNPVGSGARALGTGGAFIAVADDATAASWNPGGLIQLGRPEVSLVGAFFRRTEENEFGTNSEASGEQRVTEEDINYFSIAYPFTFLNRNMIVSLNYQHLFDFSREWEFPIIEHSDRTSAIHNFSYKQEGSLSALGLAYCIQITPTFSSGFTLNFWEDWLDDNGWEKTRHTKTTAVDRLVNELSVNESIQRGRYAFSGFNANMGFLWNVNERLTLGAVFKTPFTADLKDESEFESSTRYPASPEKNSSSSDASSENKELDMPMSYGIGAAYRFSDRLTVSADIYRTEWGDFRLRDSEGKEICPISDRPVEESDVDPTHQVRMGAEYLFFDPVKSKYIIPLRCGLFYDPAPAEGSPDDFYGFSLGTGIVFGEFVFDIAYQYRFGNDVGTYILENLEFSQDVKEHTVYSSIIIHF
ncbi:outer membrane protein transport protein [Desulfobacterales bacterium HSG2]|nr:outer membrane protein transport protein [Desulfobacterales bacterium HSG2]